MIKRWFWITLAGIGSIVALAQQSTLTQQIQAAARTKSIWFGFERFFTLDTLSRPLSLTTNYQDDDDLNPVALGWVKRLIRDFPELNWYANDKVRRTFDGSYKVPEFCWSEAIYGQHYPEFDRTILSIWCLRAFYNGSREAWRYFITPQPISEALSWESFQHIHTEFARFIDNHPWLSKEQALATMETYLILSDCGKTPQALARASDSHILSTDTRDFFQKALFNCPEIYPSLKKLPYPCVELIRRTAYPIHLGHVRHLEGTPSSLRRLIDSKLLQNQPIDFEFFYLVDLCDCAAFLGQQSVDGSIFLNEPMYQVNRIVKASCESTQQLDEYDSYMNYLSERALSLGLDPSSKQDRVLTRIGAMLRLNDKQYGPMLRRSFGKLNIQLQALILTQLDIRLHDPLKRTPNYIPAVLTNLLQNEKLGANFQERLDKTFVLGLPFIATVLQEHRRALSMRRSDPSLVLNFNIVAGEVAENPYILNHVRYSINDQNIIQIE